MKKADKYGYSERERIREFLVEHPMVRELYAVAQRKFEQNRMNTSGQLLKLFNRAYFVCMRLTDGSGRPLDEAFGEGAYAWREAESHTCRNHLFALIYSLLYVHQGMLPVRTIDMDCSKSRVDYYFDWSRYEEVIRRYEGKLTLPLNFSGLTAGASQAASATEPVAKADESDPLQLVMRATSDLVKAHGLVEERLAAKDAYIEGLEERLDLERKRLAGSEARIKELEEQNTSLSNNPFCLDKIKAYAKGLDKEEAKVITHMLLAIALEEQLPKAKQAEVRKAVKEVEAAHKQQPAYVHIAHQEIHNDNKDSQVFNGSITDSKFGK